MKLIRCIACLSVAAVLAGCAERELILEGERFGVREALGGGTVEAGAEPLDAQDNGPKVTPVGLPGQVAQADWPQKRGSATRRISHPALGQTLTQVWSARIGTGNGRKHEITAEPVVAAGRIFTMDARSTVMAHGLDGKTLWSSDVTLAGERSSDASGGGLAYGDGKLFATTGFGTLVALDPETGAQLWVQKTGAAVTAAPAVRDGLVYVVSRDNRGWAVRTSDGRIQWQLTGTPSPSGIAGGAAPALSDQLVIFPFGASELVAGLRKSGVRVWGALLSGQRRGHVYTGIKDITGDPVVDGNILYAGSQSGRTAAMNLANGERIWTADEGTYGPVWPAGNSVFLISDQNELLRLDADTGEKVWGAELPYYTKTREKRRAAIFAHYGPVLAGGRLIVASDDGLLRFFDPTTGAAAGSVGLPGGAASAPVIAGRTLYVVSGNGQLHAFR